MDASVAASRYDSAGPSPVISSTIAPSVPSLAALRPASAGRVARVSPVRVSTRERSARAASASPTIGVTAATANGAESADVIEAGAGTTEGRATMLHSRGRPGRARAVGRRGDGARDCFHLSRIDSSCKAP